jgi:hypothetical protein
MVIPMRERMRRFNRAAMSASPTAAYARLHYVVPVALVAIAALLLVGLRLPDVRWTEPASRLITTESVKQSYQPYLDSYNRLIPNGIDGPDARTLSTMRQLRAKMTPLAESEGLRCEEPYYSLGYEEPVLCDSRHLEDDTVLVIFWASLAGAAICAMLWLFVQFRESWMLPNWSSHLWYTPVYAIALAAIGVGPFLMLALYHWRATHYVLGVDGWAFARLGAVFYLMVFLQLTVLCIAALELRPSAVRFIIGTPILVVVAGLVTALCAVAFLVFHVSLPLPYAWLVPVLVGVLTAFAGLASWLRRVLARHSSVAYSSSRGSFSSRGSCTQSTPASGSQAYGPAGFTRCCKHCASPCAWCS